MRRLALASSLAVLPALAHAKDLGGRLGLGASAGFGTLPCLSLRWGLPTGDPKVSVQLEAMGGASTTAESALGGGRALYAVVVEDNLNLYLGAGGAYVMDGSDGFVRLQPSMGAQFFLFGLENLGFTAEWGLLIDVAGRSAVQTTGSPGVGVHYYF
jgi:hypothetical protein